MYRSMMQVYVSKSNEAVAFYQKAFDAVLGDAYPNPDGTYIHAELDVYGQVLAVAEADGSTPPVTGNTMQFCLHFGHEKKALVEKAYDVLKEGATILCPLSPCEYSPLMADLIDKYGVRWCIFA